MIPRNRIFAAPYSGNCTTVSRKISKMSNFKHPAWSRLGCEPVIQNNHNLLFYEIRNSDNVKQNPIQSKNTKRFPKSINTALNSSSMYVPEFFKETNPERISTLVEDNSFGMLVTAPDGVPFVSHLPFIFDQAAGSKGKLLCHMARANPQWQHFSSCSEVLAVFQGPHAYVSPSWYSSPSVPTWNYAVVHLRGNPRLIESELELEALVERLTHVYESHMPSPWKPNLAGERRTNLLNMIVGFEIEVTDIQGKFKLSQNRSFEDQQRVIEALSQSSNKTESAVSKLMSGAIK